MNLTELSDHLAESFADRRLDGGEKQALRELIQMLNADQKRFLRNRAFDLVRERLSGNQPDALDGFRWLEQVMKTLDAGQGDEIEPSAHFSPGDECRNTILDQLFQARSSADICVFTISDDRISDAILQTHQRGIAVRVISDNDKANDEGSDVDFLRRKGVPVRFDRTEYHMHHKFAVIDQRILINGSFNWTRSASQQNEENILVTGDVLLVREFGERFQQLWKRFA